MATYSGEQYSLPTCGGISDNYWAGRWEFTLDKVNSNTYNWSLKVFLQLTDSSKKAQNTKPASNSQSASVQFFIPELGISAENRGPYGPLIGGTGWHQFRDTMSGSFSVNTQVEIHPYLAVWTGVGSSMGTGLYAVDTWYPSLGAYTVTGVTPPVISNVRLTGRTSSTLSMSFDVNWRRRRFNI